MELAPTIAAFDVPPRSGLDRARGLGFRHVQLAASAPGLRPRELDGSARRDLLAALRRRELGLAGLDLWIPGEHLRDAGTVSRAMDALLEAVRLAADLGRCPLSTTLPGDLDRTLVDALAEAAERAGVTVADHGLDGPVPPFAAGVDPAALLADGRDPAEAVLAAAGPPASARLVDLLRSGVRGPAGDRSEGRLDVLGYRVALSVKGYERPVVADARQWTDVAGGLAQTRAAWDGAAG